MAETYETGCIGLEHKDGGMFGTILGREPIGEIDHLAAVVHGRDVEQVHNRAARIVHCVNKHDKLVEALKAMLTVHGVEHPDTDTAMGRVQASAEALVWEKDGR